MKNSKIAKYLHEALDKDTKKRKSALRDILTKMKKKDRKLKEKLAEAQDDKERDEILSKIKVNNAHRKKGIEAYRQLTGKD